VRAHHGRALRPQARELVGLELTEAGEARAPRERADADQLDAGRAVGQPGEDLEQLELVVEVVLEPQHDALLRGERRGQPLVAGDQVGLRDPEEPRAHGPQLGRAQRGHGALVEHVPPGHEVADDVRLPQPVDRGVAVRDMQHELSLSHPSG
jgi:hypothetical protein